MLLFFNFNIFELILIPARIIFSRNIWAFLILNLILLYLISFFIKTFLFFVFILLKFLCNIFLQFSITFNWNIIYSTFPWNSLLWIDHRILVLDTNIKVFLVLSQKFRIFNILIAVFLRQQKVFLNRKWLWIVILFINLHLHFYIKNN